MLLIYANRCVLDPAAVSRVTPCGTLYVRGALFGVGLGGDYMIIPLMAADLFGVRPLGRVMGIVLTADGVAEAAVPMTVAALRDHTGSYNAGFAVLLILLAAVGALAVLAVAAWTRPVRGRRGGKPRLGQLHTPFECWAARARLCWR